MLSFLRMLAGVCLLVVCSWGPRVVASPVVDDKALAKSFVAGLGRLADACTEDSPTTLTGDRARGRLAAAEGRRATLPPFDSAAAIDLDRDIYGAIMPAVVIIGTVFKCGKCDDWHQGGMATGWIASDAGIVVTNYHVLTRGPGHYFGVMTSDGTVYGVTEVLAADRAGDAAVIRIDARGDRLSFLRLGHEPRCGDDVAVISHPAGRFFTLSTGDVSRFYRDDGVPKPPVVIAKEDEDEAKPGAAAAGGAGPAEGPSKDSEEKNTPADAQPAGRSEAIWMSVTADYAAGSSGGPVCDAAGRVVGMVSRTVSVVNGPRMVRPRPEGPPIAVPPPQQITFKDCVSLDTLRRVLGEAAAN